MALSLRASCKNCSCFNPLEPLTQYHWSRLELQLRENQPVSDIEKQTAAKVEQDIEGYDREIARMKLAIVSLQYQCDLAKDYVSRHKSLLAPIRRIPDDILMEIFERCSAEAAIGHYWTYFPQLCLSQVCSHWRSIVNASPVLWSTFETKLKYPIPAKAKFSDTILMNIVNMFLTKSGDHSLTLNLVQLGSSNAIHPVLRLLLNHSHRWIDVILELGSPLLEHVYPTCTGFARLRHLDTTAGAMFVAPAAPCLQSLCLDLKGIAVLASDQFPWSQLRGIELHNATTAQCIDIFSWCKQVQYVLLRGGPGGRPPSSDQPITSSTVVSLVLRSLRKEEEDSDIKDFLHLAQFPQLHILELIWCQFSLAGAHAFVSRSPMITTLSLKWSLFNFGDILELLRLLPTVTSFQWYQSRSTVKLGTVNNLFSKLCPSPSNSRTLLPRLKHLDVKIRGVGAGDVRDFSLTIVSMVQARWIEKDANERLKSVQLSFPANCLDHDIIRPLAYLREDGMTISIEDECGFIL